MPGQNPRTKTCSTCGDKFTARRRDGRYCSRSCHSARPRGPRNVCEVCGTAFQASYQKQRTCGRACGVLVNAHIVQAKLNAKAPASKVAWHRCTKCLAPYTSRGGRRCGHAAAPRHARRSAEWRTTKPCFDCGVDLVINRYNMRRLRCDGCVVEQGRRDKQHARDRRRARERDAFIEQVHRLRIYKRDGYRCKLCGRKLKMDAVAPHPKSPTIDHVVPLAQGGLHEARNVQAAHFLCNAIKGDRGGNEQLMLIG